MTNVNSTKIQIRKQDDRHYQVLTLVKHVVTNSSRDGGDVQQEKSSHIKSIRFGLNGETVAQALFGAAITNNPFVGIIIEGAKPGDQVSVWWQDNRGRTGGAEKRIT